MCSEINMDSLYRLSCSVLVWTKLLKHQSQQQLQTNTISRCERANACVTALMSDLSHTDQQCKKVCRHEHVEDLIPAVCRQQPGQQGAYCSTYTTKRRRKWHTAKASQKCKTRSPLQQVWTLVTSTTIRLVKQQSTLEISQNRSTQDTMQLYTDLD